MKHRTTPEEKALLIEQAITLRSVGLRVEEVAVKLDKSGMTIRRYYDEYKRLHPAQKGKDAGLKDNNSKGR